MCGPAAIPLAIMGAGTLVSAYGAVQEGRAAKESQDYQSGVAKNNAIFAQYASQDAIARGQINENNQRTRTSLAIGSIRAGAAARGVQVDSGSALSSTLDARKAGELDALTIRANAAREAAGFTNQANQFSSEAQFRKDAGQSALQGSYLAAGGTILSGSGQVADRWYRYRQAGAQGIG